MTSESKVDQLIRKTLEVQPDFPKQGVYFLDIFPLFHDPAVIKSITDEIVQKIKELSPKATAIVALEARGFLFAPIVAMELGIKFVPIRKTGKLPGKVENFTYQLEYGQDTVEIQSGVLKESDSVVIFDDILATGGTASVSDYGLLCWFYFFYQVRNFWYNYEFWATCSLLEVEATLASLEK